MFEHYRELLGARAQLFAEAVEAEVVRRGGILDPDGRSAIMPSGGAFTFENLARTVKALPEEDLVEQVAHFFATLQDVEDLSTLPWEELAPRLRLMLVPKSGERMVAQEMADDLACQLVIDSELSVRRLLTLDGLNCGGCDEEELFNIARDNTITDAQRHPFFLGEPGGDWLLLEDSWHYTASLILYPVAVFEGLVKRDYDLGRGILLAAPSRHEAYFAALSGPGSLLSNIKAIAQRLVESRKTRPGPITSSIYYFDEAGAQRVGFLNDHNQYVGSISGRVAERMSSGLI
ncbi:hypothetical protein [Tessaracoccus sp. OH4464_COT-324]|uniref:hypothetical protein n=1 Tax=Tessaracoccus sp. OH4464_COT-324 TaxID=2491059 RepID=UPI000F637726|nr:hypothetical protein [Tessaracoccus sp. OH4464_COT-324]RRD46134.1 hypothetical protein EII42_08715 [Tessaracoccus sp. OH4464_COT-324]